MQYHFQLKTYKNQCSNKDNLFSLCMAKLVFPKRCGDIIKTGFVDSTLWSNCLSSWVRLQKAAPNAKLVGK